MLSVDLESMMSKFASIFLIGLLTGALLATGGFALVVRNRNLAGQAGGQRIRKKAPPT